ncbi:hypothetical protein [Sphingobacterium detergens]
MNTKFILERICNRMTYSLKNSISKEFNADYTKGFEHATKLLGIAIEHEFKGYLQEEENKAQVIRDLGKKNKRLNDKVGVLKKQLEKKSPSPNLMTGIPLSKSKKQKVLHVIANVTGLPMKIVMELFSPVLDGALKEGTHNGQ